MLKFCLAAEQKDETCCATRAIHIRGVPIGLYRADLVVESRVIVEVKTGLLLDPGVIPQTQNYLKASGLSVGLVIYFGPSLKVKRVTNFLAPSVRPGCREPDDHG
jgi:GxxExxY protein